ncbi:MAG: rhodanese-like domain-containing protein [Candidatus Poribacteria bacterium]
MKKLLNVSFTMLIGWTIVLLLQSIQAYGLAADYERVTVDELKGLLDKKADVVVVDVRDKDGYDIGHIPGAVSMPLPDGINARHGELPKDKTIILYCA